jgi:FkbM family methyltransferase
MKPFDERYRFDLPLNENSVVLDIGSHEGWFAGEIWHRYKCNIHAFEPCERFRQQLSLRFVKEPKVRIYQYALGAKDDSIRLGVKGDMTGAFCTDPNDYEVVQIKDVVPVLDGIGEVDVVSMNCEGGEYAILERLLDAGMIRLIKHLSVQTHTVVPNYEARCAAIFKRLKKTHDHVYGSPFVWDGFTLRQ